MNNTIVIDTETMDTVNTALLLSIGAFAFDVNNLAETREFIRDTENEYSCAFYCVTDAHDQLLTGRTVSQSTQKWWADKKDAQERLDSEDKLQLRDALCTLSIFINSFPGAVIYFRGPDFDGAILEHAFKSHGIKCPWKYNQKRDVRTFIDVLCGTSKGYIADFASCFTSIPHFSLHDAMRDAEQMAYAKDLPRGVN